MSALSADFSQLRVSASVLPSSSSPSPSSSALVIDAGVDFSSSSSSLSYPHSRVDGVNLDACADPFLLPRASMLHRLLDPSHLRILLTAPPAAGKTSMIQLIMRDIQKRKGKVVKIEGVAAPRNKGTTDMEITTWLNTKIAEHKQVTNEREAVTTFTDALDYYDAASFIDDVQRVVYSCMCTLVTTSRAENKGEFWW